MGFRLKNFSAQRGELLEVPAQARAHARDQNIHMKGSHTVEKLTTLIEDRAAVVLSEVRAEWC